MHGRSLALAVVLGYDALAPHLATTRTPLPDYLALVGDASELFDWAAARPGIDASRIAVHGRSLGTGVAVQLAAVRSLARQTRPQVADSAAHWRVGRGAGSTTT